MTVTRFAPSPTGYLHIGGLRTALYAYLLAKHDQGRFILRIEDTDQSREVTGATENILVILKKFGFTWDEGLFLSANDEITEKGANGPYIQSKRLELYKKYAEQLVVSGHAYHCFCSSERLAELRDKQTAEKLPPRYDGHCRDLSPEEINKRISAGEPYVIRLKVPREGEVEFIDPIRGKITFACAEVDDQVLMKSDGFPTYHLAVVVDDHLMEVTHVLRGDEWLPSTPKQILLYQYLNWEMPVFAHLPVITNPDHTKLSKRQGDVAVEQYLAKGYLPEAIINYMVLLGWHPTGDREFFTLSELVEVFSLARVSPSSAIFDLEKLKWFNAHYLKEKSVAELVNLCQPFLPQVEPEKLEKIIASTRDRLNILSDIIEIAEVYLTIADYAPLLLNFKQTPPERTTDALSAFINKLESVEIDWTAENLKQLLMTVGAENNFSNGEIFWPTRIALSGLAKSQPPEEIMAVLGKEESLNRLRNAKNKLG
jgi:glutamyl-tRNA synthetase